MFLGTYYHTIDEKGRLSIPSKFREVIEGKYEGRLVLTPIKTCILAYPRGEWGALVEKLERMPEFERKRRNLRRLLYAHATEVVLDRHGRILIPQHMRTISGLNREVAIIGINRMVEIWPKEEWEKTYKEIVDEFGDLGELQDLEI